MSHEALVFDAKNARIDTSLTYLENEIRRVEDTLGIIEQAARTLLAQVQTDALEQAQIDTLF
jgi:hypothetical protein